jgi:uncharacterized protein (TIGR02678 family)
VTVDAYRERAADEQLQARQALLARQFIASGDPVFVFVRRHEDQLRRELRHVAGYTLRVGADHARLFKRVEPESARRPLRAPAVTDSEHARAPDERLPMDRRRLQLVALCCAVLERRQIGQIPVADLAADVAQVAAELDMTVDWSDRRERGAFVHAVTFLEQHGALVHRSGRRDAFHRDDAEHESLYDIRRGPLAGLLADPAGLLAAGEPGDLGRPAAAVTDVQARDQMRQRLVRLLVEEPCLHLDELTDAERQYFLLARRAIEDAAAALTGLQVERRLEGSALVAVDRELTDLPFPARSTVKQIALLLCPVLCGRVSERVPRSRVRARLVELAAEHGASWGLAGARDADLDAKLDAALDVLAELRLVRRDDDGAVVARPALQRFRTPVLHRPT